MAINWHRLAVLGASLILCAAVVVSAAARDSLDLVDIPGGDFIIGDAGGDANETPRPVTVAAYRLMRLEVTNRRFLAFIADSGHQTDPERAGAGYVWNGRWRLLRGADWRHPRGPETTIDMDHPVVQISARDAAAFCAWAGLRLPSEEEWEFAARGSDGRRYPWGPERPGGGRRDLANLGTVDCCAQDRADGYATTAPVGRYPDGASPFGLLDMAGNVWEWTSSRFRDRPTQVVLRGGGWGNNPYGLRSSYRHGNPPDIGLDMVGIRCAGDATEGG